MEKDNGILLMALSKVFKVMDQHCYSAVKDYDLTKNEAIILMFLSNNQNYDTASDIIKIRGLSKAHVAQSVDSLCKKGYLMACVDQNDRRIQHLSIHSSAKEIVYKINRERNTHLKMLFDGMDEDQQNSFMNMIEQVVENTKKMKEVK